MTRKICISGLHQTITFLVLDRDILIKKMKVDLSLVNAQLTDMQNFPSGLTNSERKNLFSC